jgi:hypothetical protein
MGVVSVINITSLDCVFTYSANFNYYSERRLYELHSRPSLPYEYLRLMTLRLGLPPRFQKSGKGMMTKRRAINLLVIHG